MHYFRQERADALACFSAAIALDSQDATTRFLRAQLTFNDVSHSDAQIEEDLRQVLKLKPDFADANGLLAVYLTNKNDKLAEALAFGQKAVSLEPGNPYFQLAFVDVLVRVRRYGDAEALARRARTNASTLAAKVEQPVERSDEATAEKVPEKVSEPNATAPDPDAPVLKRRGTATDVIGVVIQVRCNGNEMEVTAKVPDKAAPLLFHAKDRTRIGYTSNIPAIHSDIDPCSELRGHTAKLIFTPSEATWLNGELVHVEVEK